MLEEAYSVTQQQGHGVNLELVHQPGLEVLLKEVGASSDRHVLVTSGGAGLLERGFQPAGDERVGGASLLGDGVPSPVRDDEDRHPEGGFSPHGSSPASNIARPMTRAPIPL